MAAKNTTFVEAVFTKAKPLLRDWMLLTWFRDTEPIGPLPRSAWNWLILTVWAFLVYLFAATIPLYLGGFAALTLVYTLVRSYRVTAARTTLQANIIDSTRQQAGHPRPTTSQPIAPDALVTIRRWGRKNLPLRVDITLAADSPAGQSPLSRGLLETAVDKLPNPYTAAGGGWAYSIVIKTGRLRADAVTAADPRLHQQREIAYLRTKFTEWFKITDRQLKTYSYDFDIPEWTTREHPQKGPIPVPARVVFTFDGHNTSQPDVRDAIERACDTEVVRADQIWIYDWTTPGQLEISGTEPGSVAAHRKLTQRWVADHVAAQMPRTKDTAVTTVTAWQEPDHGDPWIPVAFTASLGSGTFTTRRSQRAFEDTADDALDPTYPGLIWTYTWTVSATTSVQARAFPPEHAAALRKAQTKRLWQAVDSQFGKRGNDCDIEILEWEPSDSERATAQPAKIKVRFGSADVSKPDTLQAFEQHFDSLFTVCDWNYSWHPEAGYVLLTAVPPLPEFIAFPRRGTPEFERFLALARDGKVLFGPKRRGGEVVWNLTQIPHGLFGGKTGSGKAIDSETPIATPSGWARFGDLNVGDAVFDENGQPCRVTGVYDQPLTDTNFEVVFSDGSRVVCDDEHLWFTEDRQARVSRSSQTHFDAHRARQPWLPTDTTARLRQIAFIAKRSDGITLPEAARLTGINPTSPPLHALANTIGPIREHPVQRTYHYSLQTVRRRQRVRLYDADALVDYLIAKARRARSNSVLAANKGKIIKACQLLRGANALCAGDIAETAQVPAQKVRQWLQGADIPSTIQTRTVECMIPERTITRGGPPVRFYPKRTLLNAIADYGDKPMFNQREHRALGQVRTTREIRATLRAGGYANHSIPVAGALRLADTALPIPPYVLGAWLGDGTSCRAEITSADPEIPDRISDEGYTVRQALQPSSGASGARIYKIDGLAPQLRELGLLRTSLDRGTLKHIPTTYLRGSEQQRRDLLAGLLDTDGTVSPQGGIEFTTTTEQLATGTHELVISLGYRATIRTSRAVLDGRDIGPKWTITFTTTDQVFHLPRKTLTQADRTRSHNRALTTHRYITDIVKVAPRPTRCISVDSVSQQFLIGRTMIPTHNSFALGIALFAVLYQPEYLEAVVCDPKRMDFTWTVEFPNVIRFGAEVEEIVGCIEYAAEQMEYRQARCGRRGVRNLQQLRELYAQHPDYEQEDGPCPKRLLLFFDEIVAYLTKSNNKDIEEIKAAANALLDKLGLLARAVEIDLVTAAQKPARSIMGGQLDSQLDFRMCIGPVDDATSKQIMGDNHGTMFPPEGNPKGRAWAYDSMNGFQMLQNMFLPNDTQPAPWDPSLVVEGSKDMVRARLRELGYQQVMVPNQYGGKDPQWVLVDRSPVMTADGRARTEGSDSDGEASHFERPTPIEVATAPTVHFGHDDWEDDWA
ncbi:LAGLIDADG family homing endonuclease [Nocardia sp. NPDC052566]|uniref:LAGLIDADG family homing endonuclease n=1 Tax=Nocardia sp. NPDC052566 TaxID=3364330 RepID=UPI0037C69378